MDIKEFLQLSAGEWFAQRTHYQLAQEKTENSKANLSIELLSADAPEIINLCQQSQIEASLAWGGTKLSWDNSVDWNKPKQKGSAILVLIPNQENLYTGQLLRTMGTLKPNLMRGRYLLDTDDSLTLILEQGEIYAEERQWFASENLRLRTTLVKNAYGFQQTAFYSEIRRMLPKPEASEQNITAQV